MVVFKQDGGDSILLSNLVYKVSFPCGCYCMFLLPIIYACLIFLQVWDRRCFSATGRAAGVLMGHLEGITFLDSRGDGRYFISNGKDQSIKLWDIRKMASNDQW